MQSKNSSSALTSFKQILAKDPKKSGLMAGLGVVMILLWVRLCSNGPASATASFIRRSVAAITDAPSCRRQSLRPVIQCSIGLRSRRSRCSAIYLLFVWTTTPAPVTGREDSILRKIRKSLTLKQPIKTGKSRSCWKICKTRRRNSNCRRRSWGPTPAHW